MYTIFIPKYQNDTFEYLITKTINRFLSFSGCDCIISSPGYMSTTPNTISQYLYNLENQTINSSNMTIGLFNGMNGNAHVYKQMNTVLDEHEAQINKSHKLILMKVNCKPLTDHRKMMFFIKTDGTAPTVLDRDNYNRFLDQWTIQGILTGSSNQSLSTYYGGMSSKPAEKGESRYTYVHRSKQ